MIACLVTLGLINNTNGHDIILISFFKTKVFIIFIIFYVKIKHKLLGDIVS